MKNGNDTLKDITPSLGKLLLEPLNHAMAAGLREALKVGIPPHAVIELLLNQLASVVAMVEPPGVRANTVETVIGGFSSLIRQHVDARQMTAGGIRLPDGVTLKNTEDAVHNG